MRRLLLVSSLVLFACPEPKPKPVPIPSGRCEIDFTAYSFGAVGNGATASVVERTTQLIGGGAARGRLGDFVMQNDRLRVVIQQPGRWIAPIPYGGNLIDADLVRSGAGRDEFGKMGLIYAFGRTMNVSKVEVLQDGKNGGYAMIAASGTDAVLDSVNVKNVLNEFLGDVKLVRDPDIAVPLTMTTYYVLSPGENRVRVLTAFCNDGKETVTMQVGDLLEQGGVSEAFNPESCTNGLGVKDCFVDPSSWVGYQAEAVAYGYRAYKFNDSKTPAANALLSVAGIAGVLADGENHAGSLSWVDENATRRPGAFSVLAGDKRVFLRDFFVGRDLAEISSTMLAIDTAAKSRVTFTTQNADGSVAPNTRVTVKIAESGRMQTLVVTNELGIGKVDLKPGNYLVGAGALGHAIENLTALSVPSNGTAEATLKLGPSRTLSVSISDPFGAPLTGKVMVRCTNSPCIDQRIDYRSYVDVESQPSDLQAIVYVGATGTTQIALPPGTYEVLATRGMEYSAFPDTFPTTGHRVDLTTDNQSLSVTLAQVVDSTGWMSADLHVHAMSSPDSAVGNALRATSFAAEGVDVLVSTDHDFITDYAPVLAELQLTDVMASMIGVEVTPFDFGHHNVFPVRQGDAFDWAGGDGATLRLDQLYVGLRERDPGALIQMNHPRGSPGGALTMMRIDTATGATHADPATFRQEPHPAATANDTKLFSPDFDAIEVMNGTAVSTAAMNDWMTFMSRGLLTVATGVSDTHDAYKVVGGYGRTWVRVDQFTPTSFTTALKQRCATFSSGPFVTLTAKVVGGDGTVFHVGDTVSGTQLELTVDVQAPEWMQFDAIEVHTHVAGRDATDGTANDTLVPTDAALKKTFDPTMLPLEAVPGLNGFNARRVHVRETFLVNATSDTWFVAMVRASTACRTLVPMAWDGVTCSGATCTAASSRASALTNAILVDADGSGAYDDFPIK